MKKRCLCAVLGLSLLVFACSLTFYKIRVIKYSDKTYIKWSDKQVNEKVEDLLSNEKLDERNVLLAFDCCHRDNRAMAMRVQLVKMDIETDDVLLAP